MTKIAGLAVVCICLISGFQGMSYASKVDIVNMQKHMDEVRLKNPEKYSAMVEKAGGRIVDCLSCHSELKTKRDPSEHRAPRYPGK